MRSDSASRAELQWITSADSQPSWFSVEGRKSISELNEQLLAALIADSRQAEATPLAGASDIGSQLATLERQTIKRLADVPICLLDAEFLYHEYWTSTRLSEAPDQDASDELSRSETRISELAAPAFVLAWTVVRSSPPHAQIIFGMSKPVADVFARLNVMTLLRLAQTRAHRLRPRWHLQPDTWQRLIATAEGKCRLRMPVGVRAMNRMLADLEAITDPEGYLKAEAEHRRWQDDMERERLREQKELTRRRNIEHSRDELSALIDSWSFAQRSEPFFADVAKRASELDPNLQDEIAERTRRARELLGGIDALQRLSTWRSPADRDGDGGD